MEQEFVYSVQSEGQKLELTEQIKTVPDQGTEAEGAGRVEAEGHKSWAFRTPWQQCDSWTVRVAELLRRQGRRSFLK